MINKLMVVGLIIACSLYMCQCTKTEVKDDTYSGVVLYNVCGSIVIQSIAPNHLGENSWTDSNNPALPVYSHVFKVSNACEFGMHSHGDSIKFVLVSPKEDNCEKCLLYVATPATKYAIRVIR